MPEGGHPLLIYVDADSRLRRFAAATFRDDYIVEAAATVADVHCMMDPAVAIINLSDAVDPRANWDQLTRRWPAVPTVIVLTTEAALKSDREDFWALQPAAMVINPHVADALQRGVHAALS